MYDVNKNTQVNNVHLAPAATGCNAATGVNCRLKGADGAFQARLRITRDF
jgi:hypothetical protein